MLSHFAHRSCLFDLCETGDEDATLCRSLEEYVLACQQQGVTMEGWRQQTVCGKHRKNQKCDFCLKDSKSEIQGFS